MSTDHETAAVRSFFPARYKTRSVLYGSGRPTTIEVMVDYTAGWKWVCGSGQSVYFDRLSHAATEIAISGHAKGIREPPISV
ncbi:hypothetical protein [Halocatena marina]|uniref:hypothetical protein n=1 Tax=Halocatena marina TaxID=2934937 RepID=UPI00200E8436|nr:hypothetical protein [Halocatena marina]